MAPILYPQRDGVPFAVALSLFKRQPEGAAAGQPPDREPSLHQLQYVLDGSGLVGEQSVPFSAALMLPRCLAACAGLHQLCCGTLGLTAILAGRAKMLSPPGS